MVMANSCDIDNRHPYQPPQRNYLYWENCTSTPIVGDYQNLSLIHFRPLVKFAAVMVNGNFEKSL